MSTPPYAVVIGGANLDVVARPAGTLLPGESNPGTVTVAAGGVGRNVAENLARLDVDVRLLTVVGDDHDGERIVEDCRRSGVDVSEVAVAAGATSRYLAILDGEGDLACAVSQMDLVELIDADFIDARASVIENARLIAIDANLERGAIAHLFERFAGAAFFVDTVSAAKAERLKGLIGRAHTIKPNRAEAEVLTGIAIADSRDLEQAVRIFLSRGVRRVFISLGGEGLFYGDTGGTGWVEAPRVRVANATGAGDAVMAALVFAHLRQMDVAHSASFALAAATLTLAHAQTTHPGMTVRAVEAEMNRLEEA